MLKQRVITALILAPLVIAAVLLLPNAYLALLLALVVAVGAREWAVLSGVASLGGQLAYSLGLLVYDAETLEPLTLVDEAGNAAGVEAFIGTVEIMEDE